MKIVHVSRSHRLHTLPKSTLAKSTLTKGALVKSGLAKSGLAKSTLTASLGALLLSACFIADDPADSAVVPVQERTVLSQVYEVDRQYRSMTGPYSQEKVFLLETEEPELLWITGYEAVMVGEDGEQPMPQDFMCHSNLDINAYEHRKLIRTTPSFNPRLFTLSQGQFKIRFPDGFGIPVFSDEPLNLLTQVLNLNSPDVREKVRHKVTIGFVRDQDAAGMQALFPSSAYGLALLEGDDGYYGISKPEEEMHGPGCLPGENASSHEYDDGMGRTFTGHWVVKPGREENRTLVTRLMAIPYDTTVHYIAVHLHPFAESLELRDLTAGETVFKSRARNHEDRIGLASVDAFSSPEGLPIYADHDYEIVSTYHNTTDVEQDSMAVMYIYLRDQEFDREKTLAKRAGSRAAAQQGG